MNEYINEDIIDFKRIYTIVKKRLYIVFFISISISIFFYFYGASKEKVVYNAEAYVSFKSYDLRSIEAFISEVRAKFVKGTIEKKLDEVRYTYGNRSVVVLKSTASTKEEAREKIFEPLDLFKKLHNERQDKNLIAVNTDLVDIENTIKHMDSVSMSKNYNSLSLSYNRLKSLKHKYKLESFEQLGKVIVFQKPISKSKKVKLMILGFISSIIISLFFVFLWELYFNTKGNKSIND